MKIEDILKQAEQETQLIDMLQKAAEELEAEYPELAGDLTPMLDSLSDEDLDYILEQSVSADDEEEEEGAQTETAPSADGEQAQYEEGEQGQYDEGEAKAAGDLTDEEALMIDKIAEADVLAEYLGSRMIDTMVKRASEYGITFETDESAALGQLVDAMGEKVAEQLLGELGEKVASQYTEETELDEKVAQELYDMGRLAAIGRLYLEELNGTESQS